MGPFRKCAVPDGATWLSENFRKGQPHQLSLCIAHLFSLFHCFDSSIVFILCTGQTEWTPVFVRNTFLIHMGVPDTRSFGTTSCKSRRVSWSIGRGIRVTENSRKTVFQAIFVTSLQHAPHVWNIKVEISLQVYTWLQTESGKAVQISLFVVFW